MNKNIYKELVQEHLLVTQQINKRQEKLLLQEQGYLFAENPITDFYFDGMNKHIIISDKFETSNYEIVINANGYISIIDDTSTVWYQVTTESPAQLPYVRTALDFNWDGFDVDSIINSFTSEVDLHRLIEILEVEVSTLKQRLLILNNAEPKLELIEDERLIQQLTSLKEVS